MIDQLNLVELEGVLDRMIVGNSRGRSRYLVEGQDVLMAEG